MGYTTDNLPKTGSGHKDCPVAMEGAGIWLIWIRQTRAIAP